MALLRSMTNPAAPVTAATFASPRRGRPPKKVFINVEIKSATRDGLKVLKRRSGLKNQGEVLDLLVAAQFRHEE